MKYHSQTHHFNICYPVLHVSFQRTVIRQYFTKKLKNKSEVLPDDGSLNRSMQHWMTNIKVLRLTVILHIQYNIAQRDESESICLILIPYLKMAAGPYSGNVLACSLELFLFLLLKKIRSYQFLILIGFYNLSFIENTIRDNSICTQLLFRI